MFSTPKTYKSSALGQAMKRHVRVSSYRVIPCHASDVPLEPYNPFTPVVHGGGAAVAVANPVSKTFLLSSMLLNALFVVGTDVVRTLQHYRFIHR